MARYYQRKRAEKIAAQKRYDEEHNEQIRERFKQKKYYQKYQQKRSERQRLSEDERRVIDNAQAAAMSCRAIAKLVGRSPTAVRNYIHDKDGYGTRKLGGRPPKMTPTTVRRLVRAASQTGQSSTKLRRDLALPIKPRRVRQILSGCKYLKYQKRKGQPLLSKEHCKK
ncbi:TPA: hypothetical protein N0F65_000411, partial [Lagenidium giganteum]